MSTSALLSAAEDTSSSNITHSLLIKEFGKAITAQCTNTQPKDFILF